jgi:transketolase
MNLREKILKASFLSGACHIGSALSCVEIIEAVYEYKSPKDIFIFAKASGVATLYCYLHPLEKAWKYLKKYPLPNRKVPGVIWSGGSLGQGLSVAVGIALADRTRKVYCLISDGELQEGQTQEALMFARHHELSNLICIIDNNVFQSIGKTSKILKVCDYSFGIDGHNNAAIKKSFNTITNHFKLIQANTVKGKGVDFMEYNNDWHYNNLDETKLKEAILQVANKKSKKR